MSTIRDVARLAGVSASTVSRALSDKVRVEAATRERVLSAVSRLGYRPNFLARGLKDGFSRTLALMLPDITNPFFPKLVQSVEKRAVRHGYSLILCDSGGDGRRELRHLEAIRKHRVDGVLYISVSDRDSLERVRLLREDGIPAVLVNRDFDAGVDCVTNDNRQGARRVIRRLIRMGHRKISCLAFPLESQHYAQRLEGCRQAFAEAGIGDCEKYLVHGIRGMDDAWRAVLRLLSRRDRPTAFFAFVDFIALGVYGAVGQAGLRVPEDVSVAGFDDIPMSRHLLPPLSTYLHPVERIAEAAVDRLVGRIRGEGPFGPRRLEIKGRLVMRGSVERNAPC